MEDRREDHDLDFWAGVLAASSVDQLMALLESLPRARWSDRSGAGRTLLHFACISENVAAVVALIQHGLDVSACDERGWTPAHLAALGRPRVLEVLCAAGAQLRGRDRGGLTPLDKALSHIDTSVECAHVLLANGVRLSTVQGIVSAELVAFERGVLRCRAAVVAMLRVKRAGQLVRWDRFLLREVALSLWATRCSREWQSGIW